MTAAPARDAPRALVCAALLLVLPWNESVAAADATSRAGHFEAAPAEPATTLTLADRISRARSQLPVARARRQALDDATHATPAGITGREIDAARAVADRLVLFCESNLRSLEAQRRTLEEQRAFAARPNVGIALDGRPPYSILVVDDIEDRLAAARREVGATHRQIVAGTRRLEEFRSVRDTADRDARRRAEEMEQADTSQAVAEWQWRFAALRLESAEAVLAWSLSELERLKVELALGQSRVEFIASMLEKARQSFSFTGPDLAAAQARLDQQHDALEAQSRQVIEEHKRLGRGVSLAQQRVDQLRGARSVAVSPHELPAAEDELRALEARRDSARAQGEILAVHMVALRVMREAWIYRRILVNQRDAVKRKEAANWLRRGRARARTLLGAARADAASYQAEEAASVERLSQLSAAEPAAVARERDVLDAIRTKRQVSDRQQQVLGAMVDTVARWLRAADVKLARKGFPERASDTLAEAQLLLLRLWQFELLTVSDTMQIAGERVAVERPITISKIASIMLVILAGYWLSMFVISRVHHLLIERFSIGHAQAQVLRRWMSATFVIGLGLIAMHLVYVPLTAFAFLGGALAIGFGFGTQTLIKNLVSGVLLLLGRQIKTGDIVEIGGLLGTVEVVDVRSTRVRGFDGRETLIPNSVFLDSNVTNWTLSNRRVRLELDVAVSPLAEPAQVGKVMLRCAENHPRVLAEPPPVVNLRALSAHAKEFVLFIWVELRQSESGKDIASDLRIALDAALRADGIGYACLPEDLFLTVSEKVIAEATSSPGDARSL